MGLYFEDIALDRVIELGTHVFTREEMLDFSAKYDPQPFHMSDAEAARTIYGALTASGWHTLAVWLRLLIDNRTREAEFMTFRGERPARYGPGPGFEKLKWVKPVYAGDTIRFTTRVIEKRDWRARPEIGLTLSQNEGYNQSGELVISIVSKIFVERRRPAAEG